VALGDYTPTADDLARIMRDRTYVDSVELGVFRDPDPANDVEGTNPTATQAEGVIQDALDLVAPRLGDVPTTLYGLARGVVRLRAAMLVESGLFSRDSDGPDTGAFASYRDQYRDALADYDEAKKAHAGPTAIRVASVPQGFLAAWRAANPDA
jgi:hypothetical protein